MCCEASCDLDNVQFLPHVHGTIASFPAQLNKASDRYLRKLEQSTSHFSLNKKKGRRYLCGSKVKLLFFQHYRTSESEAKFLLSNCLLCRYHVFRSPRHHLITELLCHVFLTHTHICMHIVRFCRAFSEQYYMYHSGWGLCCMYITLQQCMTVF